MFCCYCSPFPALPAISHETVNHSCAVLETSSFTCTFPGLGLDPGQGVCPGPPTGQAPALGYGRFCYISLQIQFYGASVWHLGIAAPEVPKYIAIIPNMVCVLTYLSTSIFNCCIWSGVSEVLQGVRKIQAKEFIQDPPKGKRPPLDTVIFVASSFISNSCGFHNTLAPRPKSPTIHSTSTRYGVRSHIFEHIHSQVLQLVQGCPRLSWGGARDSGCEGKSYKTNHTQGWALAFWGPGQNPWPENIYI